MAKKNKIKVILNIEFENDKLFKTDDIIELEYHLHTVLKTALLEDRLVIKNVAVNPEAIKYESIILT